MGYIYTSSLNHSWAGSDKKYTADEKARESSYNHEYYMKNKEKWGVKTSHYKKGDSDFDESNFDEKNRIPDSEFFVFKNKDGRWVITEANTKMKWVLPEGVKVDDEMKQKLSNVYDGPETFEATVEAIVNKNSDEAEFDIDAAAKDVIRGKYKNGAERKAALGSDYDLVQKRVNELMKGVKHSDDSESLEHKGILGMKWGKKNGPPYPLDAADHSVAEKKSGKSGWTKEAQKEASKDISSVKKESSAPKKEDNKNNKPKESEKKSAKNMTDEELRAAVNRLQLETQYKNYLEQVTPKTVETGKSAVAKFAKKLGKDIAIKTITTAANSYATKLGNEIGTRGANATISKFTNKS